MIKMILMKEKEMMIIEMAVAIEKKREITYLPPPKKKGEIK